MTDLWSVEALQKLLEANDAVEVGVLRAGELFELLHILEHSDFVAGSPTVSSHCLEVPDYSFLPLRPSDQVVVFGLPPPSHFIKNPYTAPAASAAPSTIYKGKLDPSATLFMVLHAGNLMPLSPCAAIFIFVQPSFKAAFRTLDPQFHPWILVAYTPYH
jgi:hypothetical protein